MSRIVTADCARPDGKPGECFYCNMAVGAEHKADCSAYRKTVTIRAIIEYPIEVPHSWTKDDIEFHRNEGTWCSDNMLDELKEIIDEGHACLCGISRFEVVE